jgi:hypothetical protein
VSAFSAGCLIPELGGGNSKSTYLSAVSAFSAGCLIPELGGGNSIDARVASIAAWIAEEGLEDCVWIFPVLADEPSPLEDL